jgi:hypothetical protein
LNLAYSWTSEDLLNRGIYDLDGNRLDPCDDYEIW